MHFLGDVDLVGIFTNAHVAEEGNHPVDRGVHRLEWKLEGLG